MGRPCGNTASTTGVIEIAILEVLPSGRSREQGVPEEGTGMPHASRIIGWQKDGFVSALTTDPTDSSTWHLQRAVYFGSEIPALAGRDPTRQNYTHTS